MPLQFTANLINQAVILTNQSRETIGRNKGVWSPLEHAGCLGGVVALLVWIVQANGRGTDAAMADHPTTSDWIADQQPLEARSAGFLVEGTCLQYVAGSDPLIS